jgi:hypothetical protein
LLRVDWVTPSFAAARVKLLSCATVTNAAAGWFTHDEEINYQITQKGEPFKGHNVSLNCLSDLIVKLATTPGLQVRQSPGVAKV